MLQAPFVIRHLAMYLKQFKTWFWIGSCQTISILRVSDSVFLTHRASLKELGMSAEGIFNLKCLRWPPGKFQNRFLNIMPLLQNDPCAVEWGYHRNSSGPTYAETYLPFCFVNMFPFFKSLLNQADWCADATWRKQVLQVHTQHPAGFQGGAWEQMNLNKWTTLPLNTLKT